MTALVTAAVVTSPVVGTGCFTAVDPIPPPASCPNLIASLVVTAQWVSDGAGGTVVQVRIDRPANRSDVTFQANVTALAGETVVSSQGGTSLVLTVAPAPASTSTSLSFEVDCQGDKGTPTTGTLDLTLTSNRAAGTMVMATLSEAP